MRAILGIAIGLLVAGCSSQANSSSASYQVFAYHCCAEIGATTTWHPGQHVVIHWLAQPVGSRAEPSPVSISLTVRLTGPFASVDALKAAVSTKQLPPGTRTYEGVPASVTDRSGGAPTSELYLPNDLPAGYYNLESAESYASDKQSGATIVVVQP